MTLLIILITVATVSCIILLYYYAFRYEPFNFKLSELNIILRDPDKPAAEPLIESMPVFTILHLSDFHLRRDSKGRELFKFVQSLQKLKIDFIFLTGDLVEEDKNLNYLIEMLSPLNAAYGKYAVLGVHDYYNKTPREFIKNMAKRKRVYERPNNIPRLISKLNEIGIKVLRNESIKINTSRSSDIKNVEIIGVDDSIIGKADVRKSFEKILALQSYSKNYNAESAKFNLKDKKNYKEEYRKVFNLKNKDEHVLKNTGKLIVSLSHTPDRNTIMEIVRGGTDIIFCGHTHGGQVRLPGVGAIISGCNLKTKFTSGLFYFNSFVLYITRGLGEGRYSPFRFYCQPEASLVKIFKVN